MNHYQTVNWDRWVSWTPTSFIGCYFPFVIDIYGVTTGYYYVYGGVIPDFGGPA